MTALQDEAVAPRARAFHPLTVAAVEPLTDDSVAVTFDVPEPTRIIVSGIDKQAVGQMAAEIRSVRPPNVYTGKGIRYADENVRLKPGKSARRANSQSMVHIKPRLKTKVSEPVNPMRKPK